jgi:hypothetical protein
MEYCHLNPIDWTYKKASAMVQRLVCLITVGLILSGGTAMASDSRKEAAAVSAAEKWLVTVDAGKYAASWKEASEFFRNAVRPEQWEQSIRAARKPLGKLISRKVQTTTYKTSLPGAPDGEYVVIQFETSFVNKKAAIETVTPMMDKDGKWRVSGYYIK